MLAMGTIGYSLAVYGEKCELCDKEHDGDCPKLLVEVISDMNYEGPTKHRTTTDQALIINHKKDKKIFLQFLEEYFSKNLLYILENFNCDTLKSKFGRTWEINYRGYGSSDPIIPHIVAFAETLLQTEEDCVWLECALTACARKHNIEFKPGLSKFFKPLADRIMAEEFSEEKDPFEEDDDGTDEETSHEAAITRLVHDIGTIHPKYAHERDFIDEVHFMLSVCAHRYGFPWTLDYDYTMRDRNFWSLANTIQRGIRNTHDAVWIHAAITEKHSKLKPAPDSCFVSQIKELMKKDTSPLSLPENMQAIIRQKIEQTTPLQAEFILTMIGRMSPRLAFSFPRHKRLDTNGINFEILNRIGKLVQTQEDAIRIEEEGLRRYGETVRLSYTPMLPPSYTQKRDWFRKYRPDTAPEILQNEARKHAAIVQEFCTIIRQEATTYEHAIAVQDTIISSAGRNCFPWEKKNVGHIKGGSWYIFLLKAGENILTRDDALAYDRAVHEASAYFGYNYTLQEQ